MKKELAALHKKVQSAKVSTCSLWAIIYPDSHFLYCVDRCKTCPYCVGTLDELYCTKEYIGTLK